MIRNVNKFCLAIITACFLNGCSTVTPIDVHTINENKLPLSIPKYGELELYPVQWKVQIIDDKPYYSLDTTNFTNLSKNLTEIQIYLKYLKKYIKAYKDYYEGL